MKSITYAMKMYLSMYSGTKVVQIQITIIQLWLILMCYQYNSTKWYFEVSI